MHPRCLSGGIAGSSVPVQHRSDQCAFRANAHGKLNDLGTRCKDERPDLSRQIGVRLGQISEFSLLIAIVGLETGVLSGRASCVIQAATIMTFIGSD